MLVDVETASGLGSDEHSPPPSQLLRDLDNCNSDPVAVASCFVERVRRAGCLPLVLFRGGSVGQGHPPSWGSCPGEVPGVLSGVGRVFLTGAKGCWVDGMSQTDGYKDGPAEAQGKGAGSRGAGACAGHTRFTVQRGFP